MEKLDRGARHGFSLLLVHSAFLLETSADGFERTVDHALSSGLFATHHHAVDELRQDFVLEARIGK